jgi:putative component of toxin-antitoxin plasmid stabilization module
VKEPPWGLPDYRPLGEGVGEIRIDYLKVEYRFYGYFGPRQFTVILTGAGKKGQNASIQAAKKLKKHLDTISPQVENYDV